MTNVRTFIEQILQTLQLKSDDSTGEKPLDMISELDETILEDEKLPQFYSQGELQREKDDILKVKKVCCRSNWFQFCLSCVFECLRKKYFCRI